ncbi:MAG: hypothetical protein HPY53_12060 [Brevinematales bacterium]|nr:hypothetical protein [Brevinematales bacterium]
MKPLFFIILSVLVFTSLSCKAVAKKETPSVPSATVDIQVLGGWKMGLPGPDENIFQFDKKAPVTLGPGSIMVPADGSVSFIPEQYYYADTLARALDEVFQVHPTKWAYNHISMATLFSFAFFTTEAPDAKLIGVKIDIDANLSLESTVIYHQDYTVSHYLPYQPEKNGYPSDATMRQLYEEALAKLAVMFEADLWWRQKVE